MAVGTARRVPPGQSYVALGDSYSSGLGTGVYISDDRHCGRSPVSFPALIATSHSLDLTLRACGGADIADVLDLQLTTLDADTAYVSITVGGNDAGFSRVLSECALPAWASDAHDAIDTAQRYITTLLRAELGVLYTAMRSRAPQANVVVVGYPRLFGTDDCNALTWFAPQEIARLNETADLLNRFTALAARAAGFHFVDPTTTFLGHAICQDEWINGLSFPIEESYHPNVQGHALGYAPLVAPALVGAPVGPVSEPATRRVEQSLCRQAEQYAGLDSAILPRPVTPPDLHRADVLVAAARAGVDVHDSSEVSDADARYAAMQASRRRDPLLPA